MRGGDYAGLPPKDPYAITSNNPVKMHTLHKLHLCFQTSITMVKFFFTDKSSQKKNITKMHKCSSIYMLFKLDLLKIIFIIYF